MANVPADVTIECDQPLPTSLPTVTDNCDLSVNVTVNNVLISGNCLGNYKVNRVFTAIDDCGNSKQVTQVVTIKDSTKPILSGIPADITINCSDPLPSPANVTVTDNCNQNLTVDYTQIKTNGNCPGNYVLARKWEVNDGCGNITSATQKITVRDIVAPVISNIPIDVTIGCKDPIPTSSPTGNDACSNPVGFALNQISTPGSCLDNYSILKTWTATDACGNSSTASQVISIMDLNPPVISGVPADITVACTGIPPNVPNVTAKDDCSEIYEGMFKEDKIIGNCPGAYTLIWSWLYTDRCGNVAVDTMKVYVNDVIPPVFANVPQNVTVDCGVHSPIDVPTVSDACDKDVAIVETLLNLPGSCPESYTLIKTWTSTDDCGNSSTVQQIVSVGDNQAPKFANLPVDLTIGCSVTVPDASPTVSDNCDPNVIIVPNEIKVLGGCPGSYTLIRTWTATDDCGNVATVKQNISVGDNESPVFANVPKDVTLTCADPLPSNQPTATDKCDPIVQVVQTEVKIDGNCPSAYVLTRTWTATDDCGNVATVKQTISVGDNEGPVFANIPADVTLACTDPIPNGQPIATDKCDPIVPVVQTEVKIDGNCPGAFVLTRTWTATDDCGNSSVVSQIITVGDTKPPVMANVPADITILCNTLIPVGTPTASDDCDANVQIISADTNIPGNCPAAYSILRKFTSIDDCGNSSTAIQKISVIDNIAPALINVPSDLTLNCGETIPNVNVTATDNCDPLVAVVKTENTILGNCEFNYTLLRTWTATDDCGNTKVATQKIIFGDFTPPVLVGIPNDLTIECGIPLPTFTVTAQDLCVGQVTVISKTDEKPGKCANEKVITITWTAMDACNNTVSGNVEITVIDIKAPILVGLPSDLTVTFGNVPIPPIVSATDNCGNATVTFSEVQSNPTNCGYNVIRTWIATDECGNTSSAQRFIIVGGSPISINVITKVDVSCFGASDGSATISILNGTAPYTILWDNGQTTLTATGLTPGNHTVNVTDKNGCTGLANVIIIEPTKLSISIVVTTKPECKQVPGLLTASAIGGTPNYSFVWNTGSVNSTVIIPGAGTYSVTVTDSKGCTSANSLVVTATCFDLALIKKVKSAGIFKPNDPVTFAISVYNQGNVDAYAINLVDYVPNGLILQDVNWSLIGNKATLNSPIPFLAVGANTIVDISFKIDPAFIGNTITNLAEIKSADNDTNPNNTPPVDVDSTPDDNPINDVYSINDNIDNSDGDEDDHDPEPISVIRECAITVDVVAVRAECEMKSGFITAFGNNGTAPYTYLWSTGEITNKITAFAGIYSVTVTDAKGCLEAVDGIILVDDCEKTCDLDAVITASDESCVGNDGFATVFVSNGVAPYEYLWSNGSTNATVTGLTVENYSVTITDIVGCSKVITGIEIENSCIPKCDLNLISNVTNETCSGKDGKILLTITGGTAPYIVLWNNGSTALSLVGLPAGTYSVTVTDATGCSEHNTMIIVQPKCVFDLALIKKVKSAGPFKAGDDITFTMTLINQGDKDAFKIQVVDYVPIGLILNDANWTLVAGKATLKNPIAALAGGSSTDIDITFTINPNFKGTSITNLAEVKSADDDTNNSNTAPVDIDSKPDDNPDNDIIGGNDITNNTNNDEDDHDPEIIEIQQPDCAIAVSVVVTKATCQTKNANVSATASNGVAPYTYLWSTGTSGNTIIVNAGTYSLTITDSKGCVEIVSGIIAVDDCNLNCDLNVTVEANDVSCLANDGAASVAVSNGVAPYTYQWSNGNTTASVSGLSIGEYAVTITDAAGCKKIVSGIEIENSCTPKCDLNVIANITNISCNGGKAKILLTITGSVGPYAISWNTGSTSPLLTNLNAGVYNVTVTDSKGCSVMVSTTITEPTAINLSTSVVDVKCFGSNTGSINLTVSGGNGPFVYNWSGSTPDVEDPTGLTAGTYSVTVTDANGCTKTATATVTEPPAILLTSTVVNVKCNGGNLGSIDLTVSGGAAPYSYNWSGLTPDVEDPTGLTAGTYSVTVTDANGCTKIASVSIIEQANFTLDVSKINVTCADGKDGSINLAVLGGTSPFVFDWEGTTPDVSNPTGLTAGSYSVTVTDASGCSLVAVIVILEPDPINIVVVAKNISCNSTNDGTINLTVSGGTAPYTFIWSNGLLSTEDQSGLGAGNYSVTVTDAKGCKDVKTITLSKSSCDFDLALIKQAPKGVKFKPGDNITYTISVFNQGLVDAYNIGVVDYVPAGLILQDVDWNLSGGLATLKNPIPFLAAGASTTVDISFQIDPAFTASGIKNVAEISRADNDTDPNNTPPIDIDSTPDTIMMNDILGGDDIVDNSNNDEDDHDKEIIQVNPCLLVIDVTVKDVDCKGVLGSIILSVTGGSTGIIFDWADIPGDDNGGGRANLLAGTYSVTVLDTWTGCTKTGVYVIKDGVDIEPPTFDIPVNVTVECDAVSVKPNDASLNAKDNCGVASIDFKEVIIKGNCPGNYVIERTWTVTDVNGLKTTKTQIIVVKDTTAPVITYTNPILLGLMNGDTLTVECSNAPVLNENDVLVTDNCDNNPTVDFVDLLMNVGDCKKDGYLMLMTCAWEATDNCGNKSQMLIYVKVVDTEAPIIKNVPTDITVDLSSGQMIPALPSNVNAKDNCDPNPVLTFVADTIYSGCDYVIIREWTAVDHCNNISKQVQNITVKSGFNVIANIKAATCDINGSIQLIVSGGSAPYIYNWLDIAGTNDPKDRIDLKAGNYNVTVTDANGCSKVLNPSIADSCDCIQPIISSIDIKDAKCGDNGSITINVNNLADYDFIWTPAVSTSNFAVNLAPGSYTVIISFKNKPACFKKLSIMVKGDNTVDAKVEAKQNASCKNNDGSATITAGVGFVYNWSDGKNGNPRNDLAAGNYTVTVTNTAGCTKVLSLVIEQNALNVKADIVADTCNANGSIDLTVTSSLPVTYDWSDVPGTNNSEDRTDLEAGIYTVTVSDGKGCSQILNLLVKNLCVPCGSSTDVINLTATDCDDKEKYCTQVPLNKVSEYSFTDNGLPYTGGYENCQNGNTSVSVDTGYHLIIIQKIGTNCNDTIKLDVKCTPCKPAYTGPSIIKAVKCSGKTSICLDIPAAEKDDYTYSLNNVAYSDFGTCENDTLLSYSYFSLIASAPTGPYKLDSWIVNGVKYNTNFNTIEQLVAFMNSIDNNSWTLNPATFTISGGNPSNTYGKIVVFKGANKVATLDINIQIIPGNVAMKLGIGINFITIINENNGCESKFKISVTCDSAELNVIAVNDFVKVPVNKSATIIVLGNDIVPGTLEGLTITVPPLYGNAELLGNYAIKYTPNLDYCGTSDKFTYVVSNGYSSDEADVIIDIPCNKLIVWNAVSPNFDEINDKFIIEGIENYPSNELSVFNRWGAQVYNKKGYTNSEAWEVTWNGSILPDGAYYYILTDGEGGKYTGFIQIQR